MLRLTKQHYADIIVHCQSKYPKEACGLLATNFFWAVSNVLQVYPMTNIEDSPIGYSMDPKEQLLIDKQMRKAEHRLCGIYHSHTASDAYPSTVDESLALGPEIAYVLVSLKDRQNPVLKSYRINLLRPVTKRIVEEPVEIVEDLSEIRQEG